MKLLFLLATLALPGCTDKMVAIKVTVAAESGAKFGFRTEPAETGTVRVTVAPKSVYSSGKETNLHPALSTFKVEGFPAVSAEEITEGEDSYTLRFRMQPEAIKAVDQAARKTTVRARLVVPTDTLSGNSGATAAWVRLEPEHAGPLTELEKVAERAGKGVGEFMRSLYSAR